MKTITLYPSWTEQLRNIGFGIAAIVLASLAMGEAFWVPISIIGLGVFLLIYALLHYLPGFSYLRLQADGFEVVSFWRRWVYRWEEVSSIKVANSGYVSFVCERRAESDRIFKKLTARGEFHSKFGVKSQDLVELMWSYKRGETDHGAA